MSANSQKFASLKKLFLDTKNVHEFVKKSRFFSLIINYPHLKQIKNSENFHDLEKFMI